MAVSRHISDLPDQQLQDRRALGLDRFDEVWNGELHMHRSPTPDHQRIALRLATIFTLLADERDLEVFHNLDVLDPVLRDQNYRQPDVAIVRPGDTDGRGIIGPCELVVEVRSPRDETFLKLGFYAATGAKQVLVIEPTTRTAELYDLVDGEYRVNEGDGDGGLTIAALPVSFESVAGADGTVLRITWPESSFDL